MSDNSRQAGLTPQQAQALIADHEAEFGPDTSEIMHTFPDGFTIRQPASLADEFREGMLMNNCVGDNAALHSPQEWREQTWPQFESLRDPHNIPKATWTLYGGDMALGHGNDPVHPKYHPYLDEYGVEYVGPDDVCSNCGSAQGVAEGYDDCQSCGHNLHYGNLEVDSKRVSKKGRNLTGNATLWEEVDANKLTEVDIPSEDANGIPHGRNAYSDTGSSAPANSHHQETLRSSLNRPHSSSSDSAASRRNGQSNSYSEDSIASAQHGHQRPTQSTRPDGRPDRQGQVDKRDDRRPGAEYVHHRAAGGDQVYWHVAPADRHESIMRHGLQGAVHPTPYQEDVEGPIQHPRGNYLFSDLNHAGSYADWRESVTKQPHYIYEVNGEGLDIGDDPENQGAYETERTMFHDGQDVWPDEMDYPEWLEYGREADWPYPFRHLTNDEIGPERIKLIDDGSGPAPLSWQASRRPEASASYQDDTSGTADLAANHLDGDSETISSQTQAIASNTNDNWSGSSHQDSSASNIPTPEELEPYKHTSECYEWAQAVNKQWPHLQYEAGFYDHPDGRPRDHAWTIAPDGTIVDTTARQFASRHPLIIPTTSPLYSRYISYTRHPEQMDAVQQARGICNTCGGDRQSGHTDWCDNQSQRLASAQRSALSQPDWSALSANDQGEIEHSRESGKSPRNPSDLPIIPPPQTHASHAHIGATPYWYDPKRTMWPHGCPYCMSHGPQYVDPGNRYTPPKAYCEECNHSWDLTGTIYDPLKDYTPSWMTPWRRNSNSVGTIGKAEDLLGVPIDIAIGVPHGSFHLPQTGHVGRIVQGMPYEPGRDRAWHMGLCGEYAMALQQMYPHLKLGYMETQYHDPHAGPERDPEDDDRVINHIFAHDDQHMYDVFGKKSLDAAQDYDDPAVGESYHYTLGVSPGELRDLWPISPELVQEAQQRIQQHSDAGELPTPPPREAKESLADGTDGGSHDEDSPYWRTLHAASDPEAAVQEAKEHTGWPVPGFDGQVDIGPYRVVYERWGPECVSSGAFQNLGYGPDIEETSREEWPYMDGPRDREPLYRSELELRRPAMEQSFGPMVHYEWDHEDDYPPHHDAMGWTVHQRPEGETPGGWLEHYGASEPQVMYHVAPKAIRGQIKQEGLKPAWGGGFATGQTPLRGTPLSGVYLTSDPKNIGVPGEFDPSEHDVWEVHTDGLRLEPDWPAVVEHGAYTEPDHIWFEEGHPLGDQLHEEYGDKLYPDDLHADPRWQELTGTVRAIQPIPPERIRRIASENSPQVMYHTAPSAYRQSILEHGLQPGISPRNFSSAYGYPDGTYLTDNPDDAEVWREWHEDFGPMDIWKVDTSHYSPQPDPDVERFGADFDGRSSVIYEPIHPSHIDLYDKGDEGPWSRFASEDSPWYEDPDKADFQHGLCDTYTLAMMEILPEDFSKTAKGGIFYHVAPTSAREEILRGGLRGHDQTQTSPWQELYDKAHWQTPSGVYMWDHPDNARSYAYAVQGQVNPHSMYPGDEDGWVDYDHNGEPPELYDEEADEYSPNPNYTEPGWDIWQVNAQGLPVQIDPEPALQDGELTAEEAQAEINRYRDKWGGPPDKTEGHRWYVPSEHPVGPERVSLHSTIPYSDMTEDNFYNALEEGHQVPEAWTRVPLDEWNENARKRYLGRFISWLPRL